MSNHIYTNHAHRRAAQRGIGQSAIDAVLAFGTISRQAGGRLLYFMTNKAIAAVKTRDGVDLSPYARVGVVTSPDGYIVTVFRGDYSRARRLLQST